MVEVLNSAPKFSSKAYEVKIALLCTTITILVWYYIRYYANIKLSLQYKWTKEQMYNYPYIGDSISYIKYTTIIKKYKYRYNVCSIIIWTWKWMHIIRKLVYNKKMWLHAYDCMGAISDQCLVTSRPCSSVTSYSYIH